MSIFDFSVFIMIRKFNFFLCFLLLSISVSAQTYMAKVFKSDGDRQPLFHADYKVVNSELVVAKGKTYFDGGLKFNLTSSGTYYLTVSYPGFKDTVISISSKKIKKGEFYNDTIFLQKNGMRLMGKLIDKEQDLPIKDAVIVLKNVMTREEVFQTTGLDGYYNFKLDFETNYQVRVDKFSEGIINRFQDTSFYVSTIGFTLPLDFKLDIKLPKARGYTNPRNVSYTFDSSKLKPVLAVKKSVDTPKENVPIIASSTEQKIVLEKPISPSIQNVEISKEKVLEQPPNQIILNPPPVAQNTIVKGIKVNKRESKRLERAKRKADKLDKVKTPLDSTEIKNNAVLEARKRIEEQNKLLYDKMKRETYETTQKELMSYYESKLKSEGGSQIDLSTTTKKSQVTSGFTRSGKILITGKIYNSSDQLPIGAANVSVRPVNSVFSKEMNTDANGYFEIEVDSGQIYIISFFKDEFKISKQLVDLSITKDKIIKIQDIFMTENMELEITSELPVLYFEKNKSDLSESITEELTALSVLMKGNRKYTIKLFGLSAADENFIKPLSTSRVTQVAQYLVSAGVNQNQIKFIALGDSKRRSNCGFNRPCSETDYNNDRVVIYMVNQN